MDHRAGAGGTRKGTAEAVRTGLRHVTAEPEKEARDDETTGNGAKENAAVALDIFLCFRDSTG
jgi:hypothetical protein